METTGCGNGSWSWSWSWRPEYVSMDCTTANVLGGMGFQAGRGEVQEDKEHCYRRLRAPVSVPGVSLRVVVRSAASARRLLRAWRRQCASGSRAGYRHWGACAYKIGANASPERSLSSSQAVQTCTSCRRQDDLHVTHREKTEADGDAASLNTSQLSSQRCLHTCGKRERRTKSGSLSGRAAALACQS